jgi:hypothetical protein
MALSGGRELTIFGEWNGRHFDPYTVQDRDELFLLAKMDELALLLKVA